ncbi:hypothetical protein KP509_28G064500 [Ceratopteris richardii]|uniref:Very-long-chain 3-oxoacyl-CoA synthase n=1 Tax=Ceratopteris richardii TaxID=49495 RepID=A0A8T2RFK1_CERRI|nr:hypothetical protein KP509_28G064500 [Ceratopteris richardii]
MEAVESFYHAVDEAISRGFFRFLQYAGVQLSETGSTKGLPMVDSPTPVLLAIITYIMCVIFGLRYIKNANLKPRYQEPFLLKVFVILHNLFCFCLSLYMCLSISLRAFRLNYSLWGNAYDPHDTVMAFYIYVFYMSKYPEFLDTIIMLLKHNVRQVSVLHVYHHVSIAFIWWMIAHHAPGGDAYFSAAMNSGVHVFMYLYYLFSALLRNNEKARRKYLFWGIYLTQLQMLQFFFNMIQAFYCMKFKPLYPQFLCKILFYYMISLLVLFSNFYLKKYVSGVKGKEE